MTTLKLFRQTDIVSCNGCGKKGDGPSGYQTLLYFSCETEPHVEVVDGADEGSNEKGVQTTYWGQKDQTRFCKSCLKGALPIIQEFCSRGPR